MIDISGNLFISTACRDAAELARSHGFGLELVEFCTAFNMDTEFEIWDDRVRRRMSGVDRFIFHAPFNELCPAAIDPMIIEIAKKRYAQAYALMKTYGIDTMIAHSGFMPVLYDEGWFTEHSILFWREFLKDKPDNFKLYIENVFEPNPELLREIVSAINDKRFLLCLDIGHAANSNGGISAAEWIRRTLPFLGHVHLHNNDGSRDAHNALDDGVIDIAEVINGIAETAPDVTFTIEARDGESSVEWLITNGFINSKGDGK